MKQKGVAGFCVMDEMLQSIFHVFGRCPFVREDGDIPDGISKMFEQNIPDIGHIVDAAVKVISGSFVLVDPDQESFFCHKK